MILRNIYPPSMCFCNELILEGLEIETINLTKNPKPLNPIFHCMSIHIPNMTPMSETIQMLQDSANKIGATSLMAASLQNHVGLLRLLMERGADVNLRCKDERGRYPNKTFQIPRVIDLYSSGIFGFLSLSIPISLNHFYTHVYSDTSHLKELEADVDYSP